MKIGLNVFADQIVNGNKAADIVTDNGKLIDFAVCHVDGQNYTIPQATELAHTLNDVFEKQDTDFITNFEYANWREDCTAPDGTQWAENSDGCHRVKLPDEFVKALAESKKFKGIMYDEFEHAIINRNTSIQLATKFKKILPVFPFSKERDAIKQGKLLKEQIIEYVDSFKSQGAQSMLGEHVYPVLLHKFAESGIIPNYKSLKENFSNVAFSIAAGAAMQYDLPLFNCVDNWFMNTNPGHSPSEMYYNLLFAFLAGVDCAYVESVNVMTDKGKITEHGEEFRRFCKEYKDKNREYSIKDYRPEIGIIRYDDGLWGQWYPILFKKCLFGNPKIKPDYRSKEYFKIFNILTHGETCKNGLSWDRISPWMFFHKHFSFASLNSTAVFDHNADKKVLDSLKLCFLCGIHISEKTLKEVRNCVRENGLTVVTPKRFAPSEIAAQAKGKICEINDGKGKWIVIRSYRTKGLKNSVKDFIGKKGEMRLTFADREIIMKINGDRDSFSVVKQ
ncbi:MAG: hypothetical protein MJ120_00790 [Clostridia bacterium]|nr:hypothetical protein [Clostridia bacterium]